MSGSLWTRRFIILLICETSFALSFSIFLLLPKYLIQHFEATPAELGTVSACFGISAFVFTPLVGIWVDRFGRRSFALAGALLMALTAVGFLQVDQIGITLYALRLLQGVAFAFSFVACATLVADQAPLERMSEALGLFGISFQAMHGVGPALVEWIVVVASWSAAFYLAIAAALFSALVVFWVQESTQHADHGEAPSLFQLITRPLLARNILVVALCGCAFAAMMIYHQPWALAHGIEKVGVFFTAFSLSSILVRIGLGHLADRLGRYRVSIAALSFYGLTVLAMLQLESLGLLVLGVAYGIAHGFFYPALNGLALEHASAAERGKVVALFNGGFNGGFTLGTWSLGLLAEQAGLASVFWAGASACILGVLVLIFLRNLAPGATFAAAVEEVAP